MSHFLTLHFTRDSDDSTGGDNSSFYGAGRPLLVTDGTLTIDEADITTDAAGGAGVFAYGDGTKYVNDATIEPRRVPQADFSVGRGHRTL